MRFLPQDIDRPMPRDRFAIGVLFAFASGLLLCWPLVQDIWTTGMFHDSDDAMRMVQVRDWMAGQGWYDLVAHRMGLAGGPPTHWSRVIDLPLAALVSILSPTLGAVQGERAARIGFALLLQLGLFAAVARAAITLAGPRAMAPALAVAVLSGTVFAQFQPGRIDHHAPQIVLLVLILTSAVRAAGHTEDRRDGLACGLLVALSLSISLENLPMIAGVAAALGTSWIVGGSARARALGGFGCGTALGLCVILPLTVPPAFWFTPACDGASIVHLTMALAGAAACMALPRVAGADMSWHWRLAASILAALGLVMLLRWLFPSCGLDPYIGTDPVVRHIWLDQVKEARTLVQALGDDPSTILALLVPSLLGLGGMVAAAAVETGASRRQWSIACAMGIATLATTIWKINAISALIAIAGLGVVWPLLQLQTLLARRGAQASGIVVLACSIPLSSTAFALVLPDAANAPPVGPDFQSCLRPTAFEGLRSLPTGTVLAEINAGAHLLAETPHRVLAAPYHRNNAGNRLAIDAFLSPVEAAREIVLQSGATYVATCPERRALEGRGNLGDFLGRGAPPAWLTRIPVAGPWAIYAVAR